MRSKQKTKKANKQTNKQKYRMKQKEKEDSSIVFTVKIVVNHLYYRIMLYITSEQS